SGVRELLTLPDGRSYFNAARDAIARVGHAWVDMGYFPAANVPPADYCRQRIKEADVILVLAGHRYGSLVPEEPNVSFCEFEYNVAMSLGLTCLAYFVDDPGLEGSGGQSKHDVRLQEAFRIRLQAAHTVSHVRAPQELETQVVDALHRLPAVQ